MERFRILSKKIIIISLILSIISIYMPAISLVSLAANNITSLNTPSNLRWKDKSTATASWDAVENANYYLVNVIVYNEEEMIGIQETGTSTNEIDLQQEIYTILQSRNLESYQITFNVCAKYISDNEDIASEISNNCELLSVNRKSGIKLTTPTNVSIDDNRIARWTDVPEAGLYQVEYSMKYNNVVKTYTSLFIWKHDGKIKDGMFEIDLTDSINDAYKYLKYNNETVEVSFKVLSRASAGDNIHIDGDYSNSSNSIAYSQSTTKLATPTDVSIDDNRIARWTDVPEAGLYQVEYSMKYNNVVKTYTSLFIWKHDGKIKDGMFEIDLTNSINNAYKYLKYNNETVEVSFKVLSRANAEDNIHTDSEYSILSNSITYSQNITKLTTPTNVSIDDNRIARWTNIPEAGLYKVEYSMKYNNVVKTFTSLFIWKNDGKIKDGMFEVDLTNGINNAYNFYKYGDKTIEISIKVAPRANAEDNIHIDGDYSKSSNNIFYNPNGSTVINEIALSPNKPVIAVGRTIYLGKTITPEDAIYDKINWSTSDNSIVSINNMGQITGIKKGNATITAQINNASQSADVSVYEITSNISNSEENSQVLDKATDIITAITKDEDTSNTDITNISEAINEIETGAENGDIFNVDMLYEEKNANDFDAVKEDINSQYVDYEIAGGRDIKIKLSHTDNNGNKHHITNITELENNISIDFDISSNLPKLEKKKKREYKLIRCHDNNIEELDFNMQNGKVEASSNKFSDFIVLYKDTDINYVIGDINGDDKVNIKDWNKLYNYINETEQLNEQELLRADVNGDGKVNGKDWNRMYEHISEVNPLF